MSTEPLALSLAALAEGLRLLLEGLSVATVLLGLLASLRSQLGRGAPGRAGCAAMGVSASPPTRRGP